MVMKWCYRLQEMDNIF